MSSSSDHRPPASSEPPPPAPPAGPDEEFPDAPDAPTADYEVGYGKPPRHTRFQKGQSGNPKGRKPDSQNLKTIFRKLLFEPVKVKVNGKIRRMPAIEACLMNQRTQALKGDGKALDRCVRLATMADRVAPEHDDPAGQAVHAETEALLEELMRMVVPDKANGVSLTIDDEPQDSEDVS